MTTNQENILGLCTLKLYKSITTAAFEWANLIFWRKNLSGCNYLSAKFNSTAPWPKNWSSYFLLCCFHPKKGFVSFFRFNDQRWIRKDTLPLPRLDPRPPSSFPPTPLASPGKVEAFFSTEQRNEKSKIKIRFGQKIYFGRFLSKLPKWIFSCHWTLIGLRILVWEKPV